VSNSLSTARLVPVRRKAARPLVFVRPSFEELETRALLSTLPVAIPLQVLLPATGPTTPDTNYTVPWPSALSPTQVRQAYGFSSLSLDGTGETIAIVDAYNDPNIATDLHTFDVEYGLADPNLKIVNQQGTVLYQTGTGWTGARTPSRNAGWDGEISLDVEWAHAIAPGANIVLVEATSSSTSNLYSAVQEAAQHTGAVVVSMSWGENEYSGESTEDSMFSKSTGIVFVASSGDTVTSSYPAASPDVLAVGGTSLCVTTVGATTTYNSETAWNDSGGGFSYLDSPFQVLETEPAYQNVVQHTGTRESPDVAYDADPNTGFSVYDSVAYQGNSGWQQYGGTSAGAPQWAALVALVDQGRVAAGNQPIDGPTQFLPTLYSLPSSDFHQPTTDDTGTVSFSGYNDYTGLGSPQANLLVPALIGVSFSSIVVPSVVEPQANGPALAISPALTSVRFDASISSVRISPFSTDTPINVLQFHSSPMPATTPHEVPANSPTFASFIPQTPRLLETAAGTTIAGDEILVPSDSAQDNPPPRLDGLPTQE
jgi:subtilase family serine protease